jgi:hypothetical protein
MAQLREAIWNIAQSKKFTNAQITAICTAAKADRQNNYANKANSVHTALLLSLAGL